MDYVDREVPRWNFDQFEGSDRGLEGADEGVGRDDGHRAAASGRPCSLLGLNPAGLVQAARPATPPLLLKPCQPELGPPLPRVARRHQARHPFAKITRSPGLTHRFLHGIEDCADPHEKWRNARWIPFTRPALRGQAEELRHRQVAHLLFLGKSNFQSFFKIHAVATIRCDNRN